MKKVLLATTALVMSAGFAAADVSVGGDGRMGIIGGGSDDTLTTTVDETDLAFTSRIRISFSASGETDAGLSFGGSVRADNASTVDGGGDVGTAGSVFVEGTFGKISMGDVSGAAEAAVGDLSGVGLTGLGDFNEFFYLSNSDRSAARWDYTTGDLGLHVSMDNPQEDTALVALAAPFTQDDQQVYSIAVTYGMGDISFGLGYESGEDTDHVIAGVTAGFGDATLKVIYGDANDVDFTQYGASLDFVSGATTFTVFHRVVEVAGADSDATGVGVSYDLGGGAALKAGVVDVDGEDDARYDMGISMSF